MAHQGLEDALTGGEGLGRSLGCLELRAFRSDGTAGCGDLGGLGCRQVRGGGVAARGSIVAARTVVATRAAIGAVLARTIGARRAILARAVRARATIVATGAIGAGATVIGSGAIGTRAIGTRATVIGSGATIVSARSAVAVASARATVAARVIAARTAVAVGKVARRRHRKRHGRGGVALGCSAAQGLAGRCHDPGRLGAHTEDASATRGQDLEIEVIELGTELLASRAQRLFDGLAGEFLVRTHGQRRLPRRP
jgi:hypothetical protein